VVLLEDFHGSARWDVLPVGREVIFEEQERIRCKSISECGEDWLGWKLDSSR
jgi:hypothetical protein